MNKAEYVYMKYASANAVYNGTSSTDDIPIVNDIPKSKTIDTKPVKSTNAKPNTVQKLP